MHAEHSKHDKHIVGYGTYILIWLGLLALTSITVSIAGIHLGNYTLLVALFIAAVKSGLVINYFMHIKFEEPIFKVFLLISGTTLLIIFVLTAFDIIYR